MVTALHFCWRITAIRFLKEVGKTPELNKLRLLIVIPVDNQPQTCFSPCGAFSKFGPCLSTLNARHFLQFHGFSRK